MNNTLVIFDIDGTLTDSVAAHQLCYTQALEEQGLKKEENFGDFKHHTDRYIFCEIFRQNHGRDPDDAEIQRFYHSIAQRFEQHNIQEIAAAGAFLQQLQQHDIPYVFATGSITKPAIKKLSAVNISHAHNILSTSDDTDSREDIVSDAVHKARIHYRQNDFETKIIIGDGKWDYLTAKNMGMSFLGIGNNPALAGLLAHSPHSLWKDFSGRKYEDMLSCSLVLSDN